MTDETILTPEQVDSLLEGVLRASGSSLSNYTMRMGVEQMRGAIRAIEQAVLQSSEVQAWRRDAERLDWLSDPENNIGNVQLPIDCVKNNLHSLRGAIDEAMEKK